MGNRTQPGRIACLAAVALFGLTACGAPIAGEPQARPGRVTITETAPPVTTTETAPPVTTTETAPPAPVTTTPPPSTVTETEEPDPPTTDAEHPHDEPTFGSDAYIRAEADDAYQVVNTYWGDLFRSWDVTWNAPNRLSGSGFFDSSSGAVPYCGQKPFGAAGFCTANGGLLAWDMTYFRGAVSTTGDGAIYAVVAHEVGHAAQYRFLLDGEGLATPPRDAPEYELQADCLAGATLAKAENDGYLEVEPGALDLVMEFIWSLPEGDGSHGTSAQRAQFFTRGHDSADVESCLYNQGVPPA